jgi:hypothetical protein
MAKAPAGAKENGAIPETEKWTLERKRTEDVAPDGAWGF